jgi:hypothetical protein
MSKLNKTQLTELVLNEVSTVLGNHQSAFKKGQDAAVADALTEAITKVLAPKKGGSTSTKVDAEGNVFCNYFQTYLPADHFKTKLSKPDSEGNRREVYKANSIEAEQILRKIKNTKAKAEKQLLELFRDKHITAEELDTKLAEVETKLGVTFSSVDDVPSLGSIWRIGEEA